MADEKPVRRPPDRTGSNMVMPWGKYRGVKLSSVPSDYLNWMLDQESFDLAAEIETEVRNVLAMRRGEGIKRRGPA